MTDTSHSHSPRTRADERPLSPHLSIYKLPLTAGIMSITHRITGIVLTAGFFIWVWLLWSAAYSPDCLTCIQNMANAWYGQVFLIGWTMAFIYHLINGLRHLFWDMGKGLEIPSAKRSGGIVLAGTILLTALIWFAILT